MNLPKTSRSSYKLFKNMRPTTTYNKISPVNARALGGLELISCIRKGGVPFTFAQYINHDIFSHQCKRIK
jgi:hypothetical protein